MSKPKKAKEELYFIATRLKNGPLNVKFYTKRNSTEVPPEQVLKKVTKGETKLYAAI